MADIKQYKQNNELGSIFFPRADFLPTPWDIPFELYTSLKSSSHDLACWVWAKEQTRLSVDTDLAVL